VTTPQQLIDDTSPAAPPLLCALPWVLCCLQWPAVGSWYPLLLQLTHGIGDLTGKLLPVWCPRHLHATTAAIGLTRLLFVPVFVLGLAFGAGPAFFLVFTFLVAVTAW
jgi:hypothetical protein